MIIYDFVNKISLYVICLLNDNTAHSKTIYRCPLMFIKSFESVDYNKLQAA